MSGGGTGDAIEPASGTGDALGPPSGAGDAIEPPSGTGDAIEPPSGTGDAIEPTGGAAGRPLVIDGGEPRPVDPRTIAVWRWAALLGAIPLAALAGVFTIATVLSGAPVAGAAAALYPLLLIALGLHVWWYPRARYRRLRYRVDDIGLEIGSGILWRKRSSVPRVRIQHTDISQGPLQRRHGIATLKLYTAGSRFTLIELPGLDHADAVALRDRLIQGGDGDAV